MSDVHTKTRRLSVASFVLTGWVLCGSWPSLLIIPALAKTCVDWQFCMDLFAVCHSRSHKTSCWQIEFCVDLIAVCVSACFLIIPALTKHRADRSSSVWILLLCVSQPAFWSFPLSLKHAGPASMYRDSSTHILHHIFYITQLHKSKKMVGGLALHCGRGSARYKIHQSGIVMINETSRIACLMPRHSQFLKRG